MGRDLYEALSKGAAGDAELAEHAAEAGEEVPVLLRMLAEEAALRRAAADLAAAELEEGFWVDETEASDGAQRLAAEDEEDEEPVFSGRGYRVRVRFRVDGSARIEQEAGPGGLTLVAGEHWVPLQPGQATRLPQPLADAWSAELPESIEVLDLKGDRLRLRRPGG